MNPSDQQASLQLPHPPKRVVSLVPSTTESLFDLGLGDALVGATDYCIYPAEPLEKIPRVGGPKNPRLDDILSLQPDLVLANWEENTRQTVESLQAAGIPVWVTFPLSVRETMEVLWQIAGIFRSQVAAMRLKTLELSLDWIQSAANERPSQRYFCPIWYDRTIRGEAWWMTFNSRTYCHDVLSLAGGQNVFAGRERRYPLTADIGQAPAQELEDRDTRYPRVGLEAVRAAQPEVIILPNEPFPFNKEHLQEIVDLLSGTPAAQEKRVFMVDGSLITWHGTRLAHALRELPALFNRAA